ncbi:hypothetical protein, partial [Secundilactobacillus collinoides]|uniref:hypothetical protein n=1 Tax=Secundilactobacillus collinoides TaxID=33960 RepID=UPI001F252A74
NMPCDTKGSVCLHTFKFQVCYKKCGTSEAQISLRVIFMKVKLFQKRITECLLKETGKQDWPNQW